MEKKTPYLYRKFLRILEDEENKYWTNRKNKELNIERKYFFRRVSSNFRISKEDIKEVAKELRDMGIIKPKNKRKITIL